MLDEGSVLIKAPGHYFCWIWFRFAKNVPGCAGLVKRDSEKTYWQGSLISNLNFVTFAHFLRKRPSYLIPEPNYREEKILLYKRWEHLSQMVQHFWDNWSKEYLTLLQTRDKWTKIQRSLELGDIVRMINEVTFLVSWPVGLVIVNHPANGGLVRTVTVRTSQSEMKIPVVNFQLLELDE